MHHATLLVPNVFIIKYPNTAAKLCNSNRQRLSTVNETLMKKTEWEEENDDEEECT